MGRFSTFVTKAGIALALCAVLAAPLLLVGCSGGEAGPQADRPRSSELTPGEFPDDVPPVAEAPPPPMLRDPETAVYSYLRWITYAYRVLNSDVATHAFSVYEEVRVNSYVELNRQEGRAIDQRLLDFQVKDVQTVGETATVAVDETWTYRYIDIKTVKYSSPIHTVTYDTTYTVVNTEGKGWLVDKVEASARGEAPK